MNLPIFWHYLPFMATSYQSSMPFHALGNVFAQLSHVEPSYLSMTDFDHHPFSHCRKVVRPLPGLQVRTIFTEGRSAFEKMQTNLLGTTSVIIEKVCIFSPPSPPFSSYRQHKIYTHKCWLY